MIRPGSVPIVLGGGAVGNSLSQLEPAKPQQSVKMCPATNSVRMRIEELVATALTAQRREARVEGAGP